MAENNSKYTDNTVLNFGKLHRGKKLQDVPGSYLIWILEDYEGKKDPLLIEYIKDNLMCLKQEVDLENIKAGKVF